MVYEKDCSWKSAVCWIWGGFGRTTNVRDLKLNQVNKTPRTSEKSSEWEERLTSSSLNQERLSAVSTNQYSLAPPFMMLMLLIVSQPLRMTWRGGEVGRSRAAKTSNHLEVIWRRVRDVVAWWSISRWVGGWVGGGGVVISVVVVRRCALIPQAEACDSLLGGGSVKCIKRVVKAQTSVICVGCISAAPCRVIIRLDYCQSCAA